MSKHLVYVFIVFVFCFDISAKAQTKDSTLSDATIDECVKYALAHQPSLQQSYLDQKIVETEIKTRLADWYPQVGLDYSLQHYFKTPVSIIGGNAVTTSQKNYSTADFSATQNIFNPDVLLASRTANAVRLQSKQLTENDKIYLALYVSKAFYDVLLAQQQVNLIEDDISRLTRTVKDAVNQYKAGTVDKTDFKRAQITLNNDFAQRKQYQEAYVSRFSLLKLYMGYPQQDSFHLVYDSTQLEKETVFDTTQQVDYTNRIEYKLLKTQQSLLQSNLQYYKWSFFPTLSAFGNYNFVWANNKPSKLYSNSFPSAYAGLTLSFPIFQGGKRIYEIRGANLQLDRLNYNFISLRDSIQSQYTQALSNYKSNFSDYNIQKQNLDLANDVYNTIYLQYKSGIITYLDVIIAESDLRSTQVNYLNALYQVLSSKLDVQQALGTLTY